MQIFHKQFLRRVDRLSEAGAVNVDLVAHLLSCMAQVLEHVVFRDVFYICPTVNRGRPATKSEMITKARRLKTLASSSRLSKPGAIARRRKRAARSRR